MTAQPRCIHECVCWIYTHGKRETKPCKMNANDCKDRDTRIESRASDKVLDDVERLHDEVGFPFRIIGVEHMSTSGGKGIPTRGKYEIVVTELRQQKEREQR